MMPYDALAPFAAVVSRSKAGRIGYRSASFPSDFGRLTYASMRGRHLGRRAAFAAACFIAMAGGITQASGQPFSPIRKLSSWYTDRSLVDIEITGSTSLLPDIHRLEPERLLRF